MNDKLLRVLIVEDSEDDTRLLIRALEKGGYSPLYERVETFSAMEKSLKENHWDIILCDYKMPNFSGPSAIAVLKEANIDIPLIIVSGIIGGEDVAVECMRLGAQDYVSKNNYSRLCSAIARELEDAETIRKQKQMEEKLYQEQQRFKALVEHSSDIIVVINCEGIITYINPAIEKVLGFKVEERIGAGGFELIHPDDLKSLTDKFDTLVKSITPLILQSEMRLRHKDGTWRILEAVGSNLITNNVVEAVIVNYRDVTWRKQAEQALKETHLKFRTIFESASDGIIILNVGSRMFSDVNAKICSMLGYTKEELLKKCISDIHPPEFLPYAIDQMEKQIRNEILIAKNIPMMKKDKSVCFADISASTVTFSGEKYLVSRFRDITDRKIAEDALRESERKYQELSIIDDLTKLYNSRHFYDQLKKEIERSNRYNQPLTLMLLDLDRFKEFNDKYGHIEGDNILSQISQVIKRCLRETDSAYRYGGEEFTIILPMTTEKEGFTTAKRIRNEIKKEAFYPVIGQKVHITFSIGLAQYNFKEEMKAFVHRVDQLMYQVKKYGRDGICVNNNVSDNLRDKD
ncbi:MAG: hypothetical protein APR62_09590 [Smithella sp. SDB]|nr:MAG: hypothetical protein APR62_09590 [Smithella sp. SDB]